MKFINLDINLYQAVVNYKEYIIKLVFFRYGVINLNKKGLELKCTYEALLLKKLGFSSKFL